jgi:hypothetical protein
MVFILFFAHFFVPLALPKILPFGKAQNYLAFCSLIRTFAENERDTTIRIKPELGTALPYQTSLSL